ncbi:MAG: hypothetical protein ACI9MC_000001, partial [Kiritimatiellia bacterium]
MIRHTLLVGLLLSPLSALAAEWEEIENENGIVTWRKSVEGSRMMAFRGEGEFDVPVGRIAGLMNDAEKGSSWVDMLIDVQVLEKTSPTETVLYQHYDLSWPISDRDYVMRRTMEADDGAKVVTVRFASLERSDKPAEDCCVRATAHGTFWRFTQIESGRTKIEVEVHTDPMGWLPSWLVNMVQKGWPRTSIEGLVSRSQK